MTLNRAGVLFAVPLILGCGLFGPDLGEVTLSGTVYLNDAPLFQDGAAVNWRVNASLIYPDGTATNPADVAVDASSQYSITVELDAGCELVGVSAGGYVQGWHVIQVSPWESILGYADSVGGHHVACSQATHVGMDFYFATTTACDQLDEPGCWWTPVPQD